MHEVLAFSAILTAGAFLISSFAVFWPEYRAAQKRDAAGTESTTGAAASGTGATGVAGTAAAAGGGTSAAGAGQSGNHPRYDTAGPEDMKRYYFNYPACPAQEEEKEKEGLAMAARD